MKPDGTGDFPTIRDAVAAVTDGDEIVLANGYYIGAGNVEVDYSGKAITIRSQSGVAAMCVIDANPAYSTGDFFFAFQSGEGSGSVLEGVRVINVQDLAADLPSGRSAIAVSNGASPVLRGVVVENHVLYYSAAVRVTSGGVTMEDCMIRNNGCTGLAVVNGSATLTGCTIEANSTIGSAGGGIFATGSQVTLESCRINRNASNGRDFSSGGGGVIFSGGSFSATDCEILENTSPDRGGGAYFTGGVAVSLVRMTVAGNRAVTGGGIYGNSFSGTLDRSILWGNCATSSGPDAVLQSGTMLTAICSDVDPMKVSGAGTLTLGAGSVTLDPLFCQPRLCSDPLSVHGVYDLQSASPLIGLAGCGTPGFPAGSCAVSIAPMSWGKVKAGYR